MPIDETQRWAIIGHHQHQRYWKHGPSRVSAPPQVPVGSEDHSCRTIDNISNVTFSAQRLTRLKMDQGVAKTVLFFLLLNQVVAQSSRGQMNEEIMPAPPPDTSPASVFWIKHRVNESPITPPSFSSISRSSGAKKINASVTRQRNRTHDRAKKHRNASKRLEHPPYPIPITRTPASNLSAILTPTRPLQVNNNKGNWLFSNDEAALNGFYAHYYKRIPHLKVFAASLLRARIHAKFRIDLDPDTTFFAHFNNAYSCKDSFTGWCFFDPPQESAPLTHYLFSNFPADAQENRISIDSQCVIYHPLPNNTHAVAHQQQIQIRPSEFVELIWNIDFYQQARKAYKTFYNDINILIKKKFLDLIIDLTTHRPKPDTLNDVLAGTGLLPNNAVSVSRFDINGYQASNLFVFINLKRHCVTLYMPFHTGKFITFSNLHDMRHWVISRCVNSDHRTMISAHFSLYNQQDGVIYDGVSHWLDTFANSIHPSAYFDKIYTRQDVLSSSTFFHTMATLETERFFQDLDILIHSDGEITRDIWEKSIDASNVIPNPISPLLSLGMHLEQAFDGDTADERYQALFKLANDVTNILLMVVTDRLINLDAEGYTFIHDVRNRLGEGMSPNLFDHLMAVEQLSTTDWERHILIPTSRKSISLRINQHLLDSMEPLPTLPEHMLKGVTPNKYGIYRYTQPTAGVKKLAIVINDKFYPIRRGTFPGAYRLANHREIVLLDGTYHLRGLTTLETIRYLPCRSRRAPGGICTHFSITLNALLAQHVNEGFTLSEVGEVHAYNQHMAFFVNEQGKTFIRYHDLFFETKDAGGSFKIYARRKPGLRNALKKRKVIAKFDFSRVNGDNYLVTPVENTLETLRCSRAAAELYQFNIEHALQDAVVTQDEYRAITAYSNTNLDIINAFMNSDMPDNYITPRIRQTLFESVEDIRALLSKLDSYSGQVYRGSRVDPHVFAALQPGDLISSKQFLFTSADKNVAQTLAASYGEERVLFNIYLHEAGHAIGLYTQRIDLAEVLIEDHAVFRCHAISGREIDLEEMTTLSNDEKAQVKILNL